MRIAPFWMMAVVGSCLMAMSCGQSAEPSGLESERREAQSEFHWVETDQSLALWRLDKLIWEFHCKRGEMKPDFHPLATLDGVALTDLRPDDHPWHRAAWFCLKNINGVNYWEEDVESGLSVGRTKVVDFAFRPASDFSAEMEISLSYAPADGEEVLVEQRLIRVGAPQSDGSYRLDWQLLFTARVDVELQRTPRPEEEGGVAWGGYGGMSLRLDPKLKSWMFLDSEGRVDGSFGKCASWMCFSGDLESGIPDSNGVDETAKEGESTAEESESTAREGESTAKKGESTAAQAGITMFDHPQNLTFPSAWFTEQNMPYFNPAFLFYKELRLAKGEGLKLAYRIRVDSKAPKVSSLIEEAADFAKVEFEFAGADSIDLVDIGEQTFSINCEVCHASAPDSVEVKTGPNLYAALSLTPKTVEVLEDGKLTQVLADQNYLRHSLQAPMQRLAIQDSGPQKGKPFEPVMPAFSKILNERQIDGLYAYLLTLNPDGDRGPLRVWVSSNPNRPISSNPHEIVVGDQPLIQRVALSGYTPTAFAVGHPNGFSYIFDPDDCTVRHAWRGGFLDLTGERTGRGTGPNRIVREQLIGFMPFLTPLGGLDESAQAVHFEGYSLQDGLPPQVHYSISDGLVRQSLDSPSAGILEFHFESEGVQGPLRFRLDGSKIQSYSCSVGREIDGVLTIPKSDASNFTLEVQLRPVASSTTAPNLARLARGFSNGQDDGSSIGPRGAIDGDPLSWWDELDTQSEFNLRLILDQRRPFNQLRLSGWEHHDFAAKSFQIFVDGVLVKDVVNAEYSNNFLTVDFPEQIGQALELRIYDAYIGSPAIRELEVYYRPEMVEDRGK